MPARILIVDDEPAAIRVLAAKLTAEYYDVITAESGAAALEIVRERAPDLVLLDVLMPDIDGFEVCRRLKEDAETAHIPVVMVTALSERMDRVRGLESGAEDFLTKPVSDTTLFARVSSLVRLKRMLDQWILREETTQRMGFLDDGASTLPGGGEAHVALIDDSAIQSANIRNVLERDDDRVTVIAGYADAADELVRANPDMVIVSLTADDTDPLRLCSHLRSLEQMRQIPILLLGDDEDMGRLIKALELGVNDFVIRPIDDNELLARVRTQVRHKRYQDRLRAIFLRSLSLALTDSLTGLHNRRYLSTHLEALMHRMVESEKPLALLMADIDHFKPINDTYGHAVGDEVLCEVAQRMTRGVRGFDLVVRYGGEEFVVVMPDTPGDVAVAVAERLRQTIAAGPVTVAEAAANVPVTISIGVATREGPNDTPETLLKRADDALYAAKNAGRNRVVPEPGPAARVRLRAEGG